MPIASLSSAVHSTRLVVAGGPTMISTEPRLAARTYSILYGFVIGGIAQRDFNIKAGQKFNENLIRSTIAVFN